MKMPGGESYTQLVYSKPVSVALCAGGWLFLFWRLAVQKFFDEILPDRGIKYVFVSGLLTSFLAFLTVLPCGCGLKKSEVTVSPNETAVEAPERVCGISLEMLKKAGLQVEWSPLRLPMTRGACVERIFYHYGQLYVLDDHNRLYAIDGRKGILRWDRVLADSQKNCSTAEYYKAQISLEDKVVLEDRMLFVLGNTIVEVRESNGEITHKLSVNFAPNTTAAGTTERYFIGSDDSRFYALRRSDGIVLWRSVQPDDPVGRVTIQEDKVYFVCKDGTLYVSQTDKRDLVWKAVTAGEMSGVAIDGNQCFLPSGDTALYCLESQSGKLLWKYLSGGSLLEVPIVTKDFVYQSINQTSLLCLDRRPSGKKAPDGQIEGVLRWELKDGHCLLAENGATSYAMTRDKELVVMDNINGKRISSFYVPSIDYYACNNEDTLIFLAEKEGTVLAVKPKR